MVEVPTDLEGSTANTASASGGYLSPSAAIGTERCGVRGDRQALRRGDDTRDPLSWIWRAALRIAAGEAQQRGGEAPLLTELMYELPEPAAEVIAALRQLPRSSEQRWFSTTTRTD